MNLNNFSKAIVSSSHKNNGHHAGTLPRNSKSEDDLLSRNNAVITKKCNREGCTNTVYKEVSSFKKIYSLYSWDILSTCANAIGRPLISIKKVPWNPQKYF